MTRRCFDCGCEVKPECSVCPDCGSEHIETIDYVPQPEKKSHPVLVFLVLVFLVFVVLPILLHVR